MTDDRIAVAVYLNDAPPAHSRGFDPATASLRRAAQFYVTLVAGAPAEYVAEGVLETVFEQLNIDHPETTWALQWRLDRNRSLSVGDVVTVGETAWACAPLGWQRVTADQLRAATPA